MSDTKTSPPRAVVFDLDGTLLDTWSIHARCLSGAVHELTGSPVGTLQLFRSQQPTDLGTLGRLVGADRAPEALGVYRALLSRELATASPQPVAGVTAVLEGLRSHRIAVGVCTGRSREDAQSLLDAASLDVRLTVARQDAAPKPMPDALLLTLRRLDTEPSKALFVGDSEWDRSQGGAAGVRTLIIGRSGLPAELADAQWPTEDDQTSA
ncbi:HAD family hydrolase [Streptomyces sp. NPDC060184]|uniref:HAD family hydrolase n=1 Tax=Streptomyces sp. NPDC060184 TaxID=3347064 RepID=UPI00365AAAB8